MTSESLVKIDAAFSEILFLFLERLVNDVNNIGKFLIVIECLQRTNQSSDLGDSSSTRSDIPISYDPED